MNNFNFDPYKNEVRFFNAETRRMGLNLFGNSATQAQPGSIQARVHACVLDACVQGMEVARVLVAPRIAVQMVEAGMIPLNSLRMAMEDDRMVVLPGLPLEHLMYYLFISPTYADEIVAADHRGRTLASR